MGSQATKLEDKSTFTLRKADKSDLEDITTVAQAGFPDDPEFDYRFPKRDKYPEDNRKWIKREYQAYIEQPEKFTVMIVTTPVEKDGQVASQAIALAVWDISVLTEATGGDDGLQERRDVNRTHFEEFGKAMAKGFDDYFACYGKEQVHLWLLATHPDFRRRGAGTMLCNWGTERATEKGWVLTVLASPMGNKLYQELGYKLVGQFTVRADHEEESLEIYCLVKKTK
ncbi:acyl-CoA N-acyltransferase [Cadophora sp. MPI-SDFR-AT-0126]|nr:acyl-CoA N-acyltransferase [Leotiomycetes sp. MPI-SDFR-AT-0126]